jgi:serine/threonine-protein kinase HipA
VTIVERRSTTRLNRTSQTLGLWMNGACVGTWSLGANAPDTLQYDPDWTRSEQGRPLSLSLPFMPPHRGPHVRAWFENLLPDSKAIRERMARRYSAGSTDAFDLLAEAGRDCAGALQILLIGAASSGVAPLEADPLTEAQVAALLRATTTLPVL